MDNRRRMRGTVALMRTWISFDIMGDEQFIPGRRALTYPAKMHKVRSDS
jgi:hypothetical protein